MGRPLTTIFPLPGRTRTRAMACLRRPVVWTRGLGTGVSSAGSTACARQLERLRRLGGVGMSGAGVDLELAQHLAPERALGQHASDGLPDRFFGLGRQEVAEQLGLEAARIA